MPVTAGMGVPSLHGPAGSEARKTTQPRPPIMTVTITEKTPSRYRRVGAQTAPGVGTSTCSGRVATLPMCSHCMGSVLR